MMHIRRSSFLQGFLLCIGILLCQSNAYTQPGVKKYSIKNGAEVIELSKQLPEKELDEFIQSFDLSEIGIKNFLKTNKADSLTKNGWLIIINNEHLLVISKPMFSLDLNDFLLEKIQLDKFPFGNNSENTAAIRYGNNKFKNKYPFRIQDSVVVFFLRNNKKAQKVLLAGNFTHWQNEAMPMLLTDSGWIAYVKLGAGKYAYKFIVDGHWITDGDNQLNENDEDGNTNSIYYKTNHVFRLNAFAGAKKVYLTGSFNDWREKELPMTRTAEGWELPLLLPEGTHTYKFIVDGDWHADPMNAEKLPDGHGAFNSVLRFGSTHHFMLAGFPNAKKVVLSGSFNGWKEDELYLTKTDNGWELPYVIGPGNYEYKFIVDGKWMADPKNNATGNDGNSFLVISPNYKFKLYAPQAKTVMLAGDFNGWNPKSIPMQKEGDSWVFRLHLSPGKHRYKFVVDGEWIKDPENKLWEENEWGTGNSVVWINP